MELNTNKIKLYTDKNLYKEIQKCRKRDEYNVALYFLSPYWLKYDFDLMSANMKFGSIPEIFHIIRPTKDSPDAALLFKGGSSIWFRVWSKTTSGIYNSIFTTPALYGIMTDTEKSLLLSHYKIDEVWDTKEIDNFLASFVIQG